MSVFGVSEPVIIGIIVLIIFFIKYGLPYVKKKKSLTDYDNYNIKNSVAFWTFAGNGGPSYTNVPLSKTPITHDNDNATVYLEGIPEPLRGVKLNENNVDCDIMIKRTPETAFGIRVDVLCRIDANGIRRGWDNAYVQNWNHLRDRFVEVGKHEYLKAQLNNKEFINELKDILPITGSRNLGVELNND